MAAVSLMKASGRGIEVTIRKQPAELVRAAGSPADHHFGEQQFLSKSDHRLAPCHHPLLYIFPAPFSKADPTSAIAVLKSALADALRIYYPLAGRFRYMEVSGTQRLVVDCSNQGIPFVEAEASTELQAAIPDFSRPNSYPDGLSSSPKPTLVRIMSEPQLAVQATRFACGGLVLVVSFHHTCCDGHGFFQFMHAWGCIARGEPFPAPCHDRGLLTFRWPEDGPRPVIPEGEFTYGTGSPVRINGAPVPTITYAPLDALTADGSKASSMDVVPQYRDSKAQGKTTGKFGEAQGMGDASGDFHCLEGPMLGAEEVQATLVPAGKAGKAEARLGAEAWASVKAPLQTDVKSTPSGFTSIVGRTVKASLELGTFATVQNTSYFSDESKGGATGMVASALSSIQEATQHLWSRLATVWALLFLLAQAMFEPPMSCICISFSPQDLKRIKAKASIQRSEKGPNEPEEEKGTAGEGVPEGSKGKLASADLSNIQFVSTDDALCAHVWQCMTRARGFALRPSAPVTVRRAMNARSRLDPPLPDGYFGNAVVTDDMYHFKTTAGDLLSTPLPQVAKFLRSKLQAVDDNYCRSYWAQPGRSLPAPIPPIVGHGTLITSWSRFDMYSFNFGYGRPASICISYGPKPRFMSGAFVIQCGSKGDGGLDVVLVLPEKVITRLLDDPDFK